MVTEAELMELITDCPTLYHMAYRNSWNSIRNYGLLSTSALLDLYRITGIKRHAVEAQHRPECVPLVNNQLGYAEIRDQKPMDESTLSKVLLDGLKPSDWYRILNSKVFFWFTRERLNSLANANSYRNEEHIILEVDSLQLIEAYRDQIHLCPYNSGNTKMKAVERGTNTFLKIKDYPYSEWKAKRRRGERVVELTVDYSIPDIKRFVKRVVVQKGGDILGSIG